MKDTNFTGLVINPLFKKINSNKIKILYTSIEISLDCTLYSGLYYSLYFIVAA